VVVIRGANDNSSSESPANEVGRERFEPSLDLGIATW